MDRAPNLVVGDYQFVERLGEGGIGQVYRANGPTGIVAVKILGPRADFDEAAVARFRREIRALAELSSPNIVKLIDHGVDPELGPFLVMPVLDGASCRQRLGGKALGPDLAGFLLLPIVQAVEKLHQADYTHRDLKPENIMLSEGKPILIDFGLAFRSDMTKHTETGAAAGTIGYMSQEQIDGDRATAAADIFALGVIFYEWTCGVRPFARTRPSEEVAATLAGSPTALIQKDRRVSQALSDLIARCLSRDAAARPTATEFATVLQADQAWLDDLPELRAALADKLEDATAMLAPHRARQLLESARIAQRENKPFAALAYCDRGLAYTESDGAHHAEAVRAELKSFLQSVSAERTALPEATASNDSAPAAVGVAAQLSTSRRLFTRRNVVITSTVATLALAALIWVLWPKAKQDPWQSTTTEAPLPESNQKELQANRERADSILSFAGTLASLAADSQRENQRREAERAANTEALLAVTPGAPDDAPASAAGWLLLARKRRGPDAVAAIRKALTLEPTSLPAKKALCEATVTSALEGGVEACTAVIKEAPFAEWYGKRAAALLLTNRVDDAIEDLGVAITKDDAPQWRMARAQIYLERNQRDLAKADYSYACRRGHEPACSAADTIK